VTPANRRTMPPAPAPPRGPERPAEPATTGSGAHRSGSATPSRVLAALRTLTGIALALGTSIGVAFALHDHVMKSPRFAIASIDVEGAARRSHDALVAESGLALGTNVFAADLDAARAKLLADPWIESASLQRRLPGTILVRVTERKPAAIVAIGDTVFATAEGEPFAKLQPDDPLDLPLVTGLSPDDLATDREGAVRTIRKAIDLAAEYERSEAARRASLEEVHVSPEGAFTLVVGHSGLELVLGGPPFRRKLDQAARLFAELDRRGARGDVIMLDNDARPERVVVRMR
jgi:cell division protein FtsQ